MERRVPFGRFSYNPPGGAEQRTAAKLPRKPKTSARARFAAARASKAHGSGQSRRRGRRRQGATLGR